MYKNEFEIDVTKCIKALFRNVKFIIVMTFLLSKFVVKNKHTLDHYVAIPISTIGLVLVGLSAYLNADETSEDEDNITDAKTILLGIVLILVAMFILSIQFCCDEYFMRKYSCHP